MSDKDENEYLGIFRQKLTDNWDVNYFNFRDSVWKVKPYIKLNIIRHALIMYVERDGATEKDIKQETKLLKQVEDEINQLKEIYGIKTKK